ncbi:DHH phosphoesterase [Caulobacter phage CcrColossus]|uniref:Putative DHH phosphoesterase protein n=1 Tax=Caulobacter phage CcrColossus TaxID=1211640 RepID=K4JUD3_9CAUD|nr:DHH phosphoesterase [Caulobacter phage CcrColossus]AFU87940.1 putative DHH phosphoesterase protein [Caulobacter phage CcrColossus]
MPNKPDICLYHHPCSDGMTAAWAIWTRWPDIEFLGVNYNQPVPDLTGKHVLLVDFSYKHDVLVQIAAIAASVTILDHHKSAYEDLQPLLDSGVVQGEFDMARSGAQMAWDYVWPAEVENPFDREHFQYRNYVVEDGEYRRGIGYVPYLVKYVQDRDLWTWGLPDSKEVSAYIQTKALTLQAWDKLAHELEDSIGYDRAVEVGAILLRKQESEIAGALKSTKRRMRIADYDVPVANVPYIWASEAGNILCKGEPFAATYIDTADGRSFSLRSDKEDPNAVDVSAIAAYYGGGGHANASGFRAPIGWEGRS